jgi:hypothetical protein
MGQQRFMQVVRLRIKVLQLDKIQTKLQRTPNQKKMLKPMTQQLELMRTDHTRHWFDPCATKSILRSSVDTSEMQLTFKEL